MKNTLLIIIAADQISGMASLRYLALAGVHWNGKKPIGSKICPKIHGTTGADYILEDRR